ncbi:unnamed protein product [Acanthoscelides obtectus]|uniref:Uncharacterized protein n=1 Tax=Acanthoscelides obtectus TaxID=200917 RepID=A0A9P0Q606_ACAOB|nr:unnamed protein product [Acanthoscelides obtectus]CAK1666776.1 hypothetical protein AOBTE_LOCUS25486 [Acanthoscelides obtectus]
MKNFSTVPEFAKFEEAEEYFELGHTLLLWFLPQRKQPGERPDDVNGCSCGSAMFELFPHSCACLLGSAALQVLLSLYDTVEDLDVDRQWHQHLNYFVTRFGEYILFLQLLEQPAKLLEYMRQDALTVLQEQLV